MFILILSFLVSTLPSVALLIFLRKRNKDHPIYRRKYNFAVLTGAVCIVPIIMVSGLLFLILRLTKLHTTNMMLYNVIYKMIVLAFAEELVKFVGFRIVLSKNNETLSWADVTALIIVIGTLFGLLESVVYAINASPIIIIVRGVTIGHSGYGFIMGWFYAKKLSTGKKRYGVIALLLPSLLHGIYDFSLTPELLEINDNFAFLGVGLALLDIVLIVLAVRFFIIARRKERYCTPLPCFNPLQD